MGSPYIRPYMIEFGGAGDVNRRVTFRVGDDFWAGRENCDVVASDVVVSAEVRTKGERRVELDFEIGGTATVPCDRCLERCELPVEWRETVEMEIVGGKVDLEQYVYESIVLGLPLVRAHQDRKDCNPEMLNKILQ